MLVVCIHDCWLFIAAICGCLLQLAHAVLCPTHCHSKEGICCQLLDAICDIMLFFVLKLLLEFRSIHSTVKMQTQKCLRTVKTRFYIWKMI